MPLSPEGEQRYKELAAQPPLCTRSVEDVRANVLLQDKPNWGTVKADSLRVKDITIPSTHGYSLPLRVYTPLSNGPFPVVVFYHGGGFVIGGNNSHTYMSAGMAKACDAVVVAVDYRLAPEHPFPAAVEDSWAAYLWTVNNFGALGGRSTVVVAGNSAGGNLAAVVAQKALRHRAEVASRPAAQVLICPALDLADLNTPSYEEFKDDICESKQTLEWFWHHYLQGQDAAQLEVSPAHAPDSDLKGLPPALIITAEVDALRDEGEAYAARLQVAGVKTRLKRFQGHWHNSMLEDMTFSDRKQLCYDDVAAFVREVSSNAL